MNLTQKWINDKKARLNGEIQALRRRAEQLQGTLQQTGAELLVKQGELQAIIEVEREMKALIEKPGKEERKPKPPTDEELEAIKKKKLEKMKREKKA